MGRVLLGMVLGLCLGSMEAMALRLARPPTFTEWNTNTFTQLNDVLLQLWNVSNGRYTNDVVTVDPDGSRRGTKGEQVLYDPGASEELCVNVDNATDWDCAALTP